MFFFNIESFFTTFYGKALCIISIMLLLFIIYRISKPKNNFSPKILVYSSISIAIAFVLSNIKLFDMPFGGRVTACSMLFITFVGYWFGLWPGILASVCYGIIQLVVDPFVIHPVQLLFDYILGFGALGLSGVFSNSKYGLYKGFVFGALMRCLFSIISGIIFFSEYAEAWNLAPIVYSSTYNLLYILPEIFISLLIVNIPAFKTSISKIKNMANLSYSN